ncbi:MAG TPA: multicopper oxidase domain-containing protein [Pseudonocardiaceae bacterium]|jgi:FtsP/CotA-like multicopper oxidase with cupredoxin domain|nr:multicopper oxidase domain-containing protein [Pseudonocardiaceae bacterium]
MTNDITDEIANNLANGSTKNIDPISAPTQPAAPNFGLTKFLDPLPVPPVIRPHSWWHRDAITITTSRVDVRLHSQLPPTAVWAYDGQFPGPTIDVHRDKTLRVCWTNGITGRFPLLAVRAPSAGDPQDSPGFRGPDGDLPEGVSIIDGVTDLPAWNVVHLHGSATDGGSNGPTHHGVLRDHSQLAEYQNRQQSATLWYHDHAMAITRLTAHAGLAGLYLIRDEQEHRLGLPSGDHEVPLVITDRNLDVDVATGRLTGQLLYKVPYQPESGRTLPFTGPFTLVNGVIWPHLEVEPRWYRFRVLNAANARSYRLNLVERDAHDTNHNDAVRQIGTDGGLLPVPTPLPAGGLILAPAERADLLIDFGRLRGHTLVLTNTDADAPPEPDVLEFRVQDREAADRFALPATISTTYYRLARGSTLPEDHEQLWLAIVPGADQPELWELGEIQPSPAAVGIATEGIIQVTDPSSGQLRTYRRVARSFDDTTTIFLDYGRWAVWNILHLGTTGTHPIHIHLTQFQALGRDRLEVANFDPVVGGTAGPLPAPALGELDRNEEGWKDTIRVNPGDWVSVAGQFSQGTGAYAYQSHILDHQDRGMMRPFVVQPAEINRLMRAG